MVSSKLEETQKREHAQASKSKKCVRPDASHEVGSTNRNAKQLHLLGLVKDSPLLAFRVNASIMLLAIRGILASHAWLRER